jgi:hypothetical protein
MKKLSAKDPKVAWGSLYRSQTYPTYVFTQHARRQIYMNCLHFFPLIISLDLNEIKKYMKPLITTGKLRPKEMFVGGVRAHLHMMSSPIVRTLQV